MSEFFSQIHFENRDFFVLRDDLIGAEFNGNKARKLEFFLHADLSAFNCILSHGSSQSNAMSALSSFAKLKNLEFLYHPTHISSFLAQNPCGNFAFALKNGMKIISQKSQFNSLKNSPSTLFIPEGVACKEAEQGFKSQARLIDNLSAELGCDFDIFLPSGTGASAAFLARNSRFSVFTTPCVGSPQYLAKQIFALVPDSKVRILSPAIKAYFGELKLDFLRIWQRLKEQTSITFELLYDPQGWLTLLANLSVFSKPVLYIHQGGLGGLASQLARYERKFGLENLAIK